MSNPPTTLTVSGKTYYACMDPLCSDMAKEVGLPEATASRRGKGTRWTYANLTSEQWEAVIDHLDCYAISFADGSDPETRAEGRACQRDNDRLCREYQEATGKRASRDRYHGIVWR